MDEIVCPWIVLLPRRMRSSGIPQGSMVGPLLFGFDVDLLARLSISNTRVFRMFDDICYYTPVFSGEDLISVQSDMTLISNWVHPSI